MKTDNTTGGFTVIISFINLVVLTYEATATKSLTKTQVSLYNYASFSLAGLSPILPPRDLSIALKNKNHSIL